MRAATVTFTGETPGIKAELGPDGQWRVCLGMPKHIDGPQPYAPIDPDNPPEMDTTGRVTNGTLVKARRRDLERGYLGCLITADTAMQTGSMLLRVCTSSRPNSSVSLVGNERGKIMVRGVGYGDLEDRNNSAWGDVLHVLQPGGVIELEKRKPENGEYRGIVQVNVGDRLLRFTKGQYSHLSRSRADARAFIKRVIDDEGRVYPNARAEAVEAALDLLVHDPKLLHCYNR